MRRPEIKNFWDVTVVFLLSALVRLLYAFGNESGRIGGDTPDYLNLAYNLYSYGVYSLDQTSPFVASIRRPPFYPYLLAGLTYIGNGVLSLPAVVGLQIAADSATAVLVYLLIRRLTENKLIIVLTALCYILHPGAIYATNTILTECLTTFLITSTLYFLVKAIEKQSFYIISLAGVFFGLTGLCRPIFLPLLAVFLLIIIFTGINKKFILATVFAAVTLVTLLPWLARCYVVADKFVLVQGLGWAQLYLASRFDLDQTNEEQMWIALRDPEKEDEYRKLMKTARTPAEMIQADEVGRNLAIKYIAAAPRQFVAARLKTYPHLFLNSFDKFTGINKSFRQTLAEKEFGSLFLKFFFLAFFSILPLLLAFYSLLRNPKNFLVLMCGTVWLYTLIIHLPMWIEYRFWLPVLPALVVSAGVGLDALKKDLIKLRIFKLSKRHNVEYT